MQHLGELGLGTWRKDHVQCDWLVSSKASSNKATDVVTPPLKEVVTASKPDADRTVEPPTVISYAVSFFLSFVCVCSCYRHTVNLQHSFVAAGRKDAGIKQAAARLGHAGRSASITLIPKYRNPAQQREFHGCWLGWYRLWNVAGVGRKLQFLLPLPAGMRRED